MLMLAIQKL